MSATLDEVLSQLRLPATAGLTSLSVAVHFRHVSRLVRLDSLLKYAQPLH